MALRYTWKRINWLVVAGVVTVGYAVVVGYTVGWSRTWTFLTETKALNEVGDFLAGVFAPIALVWLVAAVFTQRQELNETRDQFEENQKVVDAQLKVINSQNALLALQHNQSVEDGKKEYRLSLFDKRFHLYEKFIAFGKQYEKTADYDSSAYMAMRNLAHEAGFLFDRSMEKWLFEISEAITDYLEFKEANPFLKLSIGQFEHDRNIELGKEYRARAEWIQEQFLPSERNDRFWKFMHVSDEPYIDG